MWFLQMLQNWIWISPWHKKPWHQKGGSQLDSKLSGGPWALKMESGTECTVCAILKMSSDNSSFETGVGILWLMCTWAFQVLYSRAWQTSVATWPGVRDIRMSQKLLRKHTILIFCESYFCVILVSLSFASNVKIWRDWRDLERSLLFCTHMVPQNMWILLRWDHDKLCSNQMDLEGVLITISTLYKGPSPHSPGRLGCLQDWCQSAAEALPRAWQGRPGRGVCTRAVAAFTCHNQGGQPCGLEESALCACLEQQGPGSQELPFLSPHDEQGDGGKDRWC